ncbi:unnamed protein product [Prorocentrum cordatum]|uniref:Uncharacterized protein n=1 Tax=Prorocentrum cordatum TaxID=2364126 RepID=A0ABN9VD63_9DINO|nr:unnamed protein product [Polarella glacialis]
MSGAEHHGAEGPAALRLPPSALAKDPRDLGLDRSVPVGPRRPAGHRALETQSWPLLRLTTVGIRVLCSADDPLIARGTVRLSWEPFRTCNAGLRLIEYQVVACIAGHPPVGEEGEQAGPRAACGGAGQEARPGGCEEAGGEQTAAPSSSPARLQGGSTRGRGHRHLQPEVRPRVHVRRRGALPLRRDPRVQPRALHAHPLLLPGGARGHVAAAARSDC